MEKINYYHCIETAEYPNHKKLPELISRKIKEKAFVFIPKGKPELNRPLLRRGTQTSLRIYNMSENKEIHSGWTLLDDKALKICKNGKKDCNITLFEYEHLDKGCSIPDESTDFPSMAVD